MYVVSPVAGRSTHRHFPKGETPMKHRFDKRQSKPTKEQAVYCHRCKQHVTSEDGCTGKVTKDEQEAADAKA